MEWLSEMIKVMNYAILKGIFPVISQVEDSNSVPFIYMNAINPIWSCYYLESVELYLV